MEIFVSFIMCLYLVCLDQTGQGMAKCNVASDISDLLEVVDIIIWLSIPSFLYAHKLLYFEFLLCAIIP